LDSGIDIEDDAFAPIGPIIVGEGEMENEIDLNAHIACGFPKTLDALKDRHGHGTQCAALLLRTAPQVQLFICRIIDDDEALESKHQYAGTVQVRLLSICVRS